MAPIPSSRMRPSGAQPSIAGEAMARHPETAYVAGDPGWADEIRRHLDRLREAGPRLFAGQLGGGVGTLAFFGSDSIELRRRFCRLLGLEDPAVSWTSSRDRPAELGHLLAMVTATLARIGNEVYQLSRPEIGELAETPSILGGPTECPEILSITRLS